jgi:repressor LexA
MSSTTTNTLTPRQQDVLEFIEGWIDTHGFSPTVREISHNYKTTVNGMVCHLKALRRKGRITWQEGQSRTIRVVRGDA